LQSKSTYQREIINRSSGTGA